jgi:hypothetical protein
MVSEWLPIILLAYFHTIIQVTAVIYPLREGLTVMKDLNSQSGALAATGNITSTELTINNNSMTATELNKAFTAVMAIPVSVLKAGDNATANWLDSHGYNNTQVAKPDGVEIPDSWWQAAKCALAIATVIGSDLIAAAKIIKIRKYITELGGVAEAVELLLKCSTWYVRLLRRPLSYAHTTDRAERLQVGGAALVNLAAEILGIDIIRNACT